VNRAAEDVAIPESSRWISFVRLIAERWNAKTEVVPPDQLVLDRWFDQCTEDAWQLAVPGLLVAPDGACARILLGLHRDTDSDEAPSAALREKMRIRFSGMLASPEREDFRACVSEARGRGDAALLAVCAMALRPRIIRLVRMTDPERFGGWLTVCKKAILRGGGPGPRTESRVAEAERRAAEDELARHCLRVMPALYEVQWVAKVGDLWTPEEQKLLYQRSQQLGVK